MSLFVNRLYQCAPQVLEKQDWSEMAGTVSFLELKLKSFIMRILSCECTKISRGDTRLHICGRGTRLNGTNCRDMSYEFNTNVVVKI